MYNYNSLYYQYNLCGKTLDWFSSDSKSRYETNLKGRHNELELNGWIDSHFTYKINSNGFRCNEFESSPNNIMFLGCSNTMGIGLPVETIWPELISHKLNLNCVNLGIGGGSCDTAFRVCHGYIDKIKPKIVMLMIPPGSRLEHVTDKSITNILISETAILTDTNRDFFLEWTVDDNNSYFNTQKNVLAIKMLCQERNTKLIVVDSTDLILLTNFSKARDLMHCGVENHRLFAEKSLALF